VLIFFSIDSSRPLATRTAAGGTAKKCDEFPSPHGFARAEDYIGYRKNITFWDRELRCWLLKLAAVHVRFVPTTPYCTAASKVITRGSI
jgi:hypothetical protein